MRLALFLLALALSIFAPAWGQSLPPSPRQLVAVNPITNKVYVANESANSVTVLDLASDTTKTIAVGSRPQFIVLNPLTNRVFVNNGGESSVSVIDGATDTNLTPTPLAVGSQGPMAINPQTNVVYIVRMTSLATDEVTFLDASTDNWYTIATESFQPTALAINPVTNKLYVAHYGTGDVRVISGAYDSNNFHPPTTSIGAWSHPFAIAANSATNKIYVITEDSRGPIGIIDGASNAATYPLPASGHALGPRAVAVNPVTNRIYAAFAGEIVVIDGATNAYTYIPVATGSATASIAINYFTNKIYVAADNGTLTVIDGATNAATAMAGALPAGTVSVGVNPVTNEVIAAGGGSTIVAGATGATGNVGIATTIQPLPSDTSSASGSVTITASNGAPNALPIGGVYFQIDSREGSWTRATGSGNGPYTAAFTGLAPGPHTIHAFAVEGHVAPTDTGQQSSPLVGNLAAYSFTVASTRATAVVNVLSSANPSNLGQAVTFTASVTGSGATPTGTVTFKDGATAITGCSTLALAAGNASCTTSALSAGTHTITVQYDGDAAYSPASSDLSQTVRDGVATPTQVSPQGTVTTTTPAFVFNAVANATSYAVEVWGPSGRAASYSATPSQAGCAANTGQCSIAGATALANNTGYSWRMRAFNGALVSGFSGWMNFTVSVSDPAPAVPMQISPSGTISTTTPAFVFSAVANATSYAVEVWGPSGLAASYSATPAQAGCSGNTGQCSIAGTTALAADAGYSWRMRALNANASSAFSGWMNFRVSSAPSAPAAPVQVSPAGAVSTRTPAFVFDAVANATSYAVEVWGPSGLAASYSATASQANCPGNTGQCSIAGDTALADAGHSWRIRAFNGTLAGNFSGWMNFTVSAGQSAPAVPTPVSPNGTASSTTPSFVFGAVANATGYMVEVWGPAGLAASYSFTPAQAGCASNTGQCSFASTVALDAGTGYSWRMRAVNGAFASAFSGWMNFTTP